MRKVSAEMPSKAQQSCVGTDSTKPCGGGLATVGGTLRTTGADGTLAGWTPNFTVAFIGESAIRAVSLRGPAGTKLRPAGGGPVGGKTGRGGAGGFTPAGGGEGTGPFAGGGGGGSEVALGGEMPGGFPRGGSGELAGEPAGGSLPFDSSTGGGPVGLRPLGGGGAGGLAPGVNGGAVGGRTGPAEGVGANGALDGGRAGELPPAGGTGFGASAGGGGRFGRLIRVVSVSTGTVGRLVVRGGRVIRTVSFLGSFRSAMTRI